MLVAIPYGLTYILIISKWRLGRRVSPSPDVSVATEEAVNLQIWGRPLEHKCNVAATPKREKRHCFDISEPHKHCRPFLPSGSAIVSGWATVQDSTLGAK